MHCTRFLILSAVGLALCASAQSVVAQPTGQTAYVSDKLEVTMRRGKGTKFGIRAMLDSGQRVDVREIDREAGYSLVRTSGGTEGWVLSRYLQDKPAAREQVASAQRALRAARERAEALSTQLKDLQAENAQMRSRVGTLEGQSGDLQQELRRVSAAAARPMEIERRNQQLTTQVRELEQGNDRLSAQLRAEQSQRDNWIIGALILGSGLVIGLIAPHLRRRSSGWEGLG